MAVTTVWVYVGVRCWSLVIAGKVERVLTLSRKRRPYVLSGFSDGGAMVCRGREAMGGVNIWD